MKRAQVTGLLALLLVKITAPPIGQNNGSSHWLKIKSRVGKHGYNNFNIKSATD